MTFLCIYLLNRFSHRHLKTYKKKNPTLFLFIGRYFSIFYKTMDFIFTCVEKYLEKNKFNDFWTLIFQFEIHELTKELKFPWINYLALCIKSGIMMKNMHVQDVTTKNYIIFFFNSTWFTRPTCFVINKHSLIGNTKFTYPGSGASFWLLKKLT